MARRVFVSFDYDHDSDLKALLVGQARLENSPFEIADWSIKEEIHGDWKKKAKEKIGRVGLVIVLCGEHTDTATGVTYELEAAQELGKEYFLLWGRSSTPCVKPTSATSSDKMYKWTWDNLRSLISGNR